MSWNTKKLNVISAEKKLMAKTRLKFWENLPEVK